MAAAQQRAAVAALQANGLTAATLRARQAALQGALQRTDALLAAQSNNAALFAMQVQQQNPYVIALLQRQAALQTALQQTGAYLSVLQQ
jgi:uncharacterized membrane-anchored protein